MSFLRELVARWRTTSIDPTGCEWCEAPLRGGESVDDVYRVCSEACRSEVELYRMV